MKMLLKGFIIGSFSCATMFLCVGTIFADSVEVTTVDQLVEELAKCDGIKAVTILLRPGDYQLTTAQQATNSYGRSHLLIPKYVTIKGGGERPEDVRIIGDGVTGRIMYLSSNTVNLDNLTLTNGVTVDVEEIKTDPEKRGAALAGYGVVTNCLIVSNHASGLAGAVASASRSSGMTMYNCRIINNSGTTCGGVYNARCWDCTIVGNTARTGEGGGAYSCTLVGGCVSNNVVQASKDGGGLYGCSATGTVIAYNTTNQKGGGAAGSGVYSNCVFVANYAKYGGAAARTKLYNCDVYNNMSFSNGGGLNGCFAEKCTIYNNFAKGDGGGILDGTNQCSVISNNFCAGKGPNAYNVDLFDCVISGMSVAEGSATRCVFKDIGYEQSLVGNPHYATNQQSTYVYYYYPNATNCLFIGNRLEGASSALFCGVQNGVKSSSVVNCTIVSNTYNYLARYYWTTENPILFQNTVIYDNLRHGGSIARDIHIVTDAGSDNRCIVGGLIFDHCAYRTTSLSSDVLANYVVDASLYCFGEDGFGDNPKFLHGSDVNHPYSLRHNSPLRGRGRVCDWMIGAYDLRGDADDGKYLRLRDEVVDIGCYQCWLDPVAMRVIVR